MDNCFTGRRDRSRQTSEKDVMYIILLGYPNLYISGETSGYVGFELVIEKFSFKSDN